MPFQGADKAPLTCFMMVCEGGNLCRSRRVIRNTPANTFVLTTSGVQLVAYGKGEGRGASPLLLDSPGGVKPCTASKTQENVYRKRSNLCYRQRSHRWPLLFPSLISTAPPCASSSVCLRRRRRRRRRLLLGKDSNWPLQSKLIRSLTRSHQQGLYLGRSNRAGMMSRAGL